MHARHPRSLGAPSALADLPDRDCVEASLRVGAADPAAVGGDRRAAQVPLRRLGLEEQQLSRRLVGCVRVGRDARRRHAARGERRQLPEA